MSAMPLNSLLVVGGVLLVITLLFVVLLVLPGKGRGWRIGLLCLLMMAGAGALLLNSGRQRAAQGRHETVLLHEDGLMGVSIVTDTPLPPISSELSSPSAAPNAESCSGRGTHVAVSRTFRASREHRRQIGGVGSVLSILGVLFAATVVLKVATRHNARPRRVQTTSRRM